MAVKPQIIDYFGLKGTKEDKDLISLESIHSPAGSKNCYLDDLARITKIPGYTKLTASISAHGVRGLFSHHYETGGALVRVLIAVLNDTAYSINTGTGASSSLGTGLDTTEHPRFSRMNDKLFVTSGGTAAVKTWDGSTWASAGGTQPSAATLAAGASGDLNGQFYLRVTYIQSDNSEGIASAPSAPVLLEKEQLAVSSIPTGPGGTKARKLYLTAGDNKSIFYFVHMLDGNSATSVTLDVKELDYVPNEELLRHGDAPPTGLRIASPARGKMYYANKDGNRSTLYPSDFGLPESVNILELLQVSPQDGDEILHCEPEFQEVGQEDRVITQVVFKRFGIWNLFGVQNRSDEPDPYLLQKTKSPTGTVAGQTVQKIEFGGDNVLVFLAPDKTIRAYNGNSSFDISADIWNTLSTMNLRYAWKSFSVHNPDLGMVFFYYPDGASTTPDQCVGWDYRRNAWFIFPDFTNLLSGVLHYDDNLGEFIYCGQAVGGTGGFVYQMFTGTNFDGSAYEWRWRTKPLLNEDGKTYHFDWLEPIFAVLASTSITIKTWRGYEDPDVETPFMSTTMSIADASATHIKEVVFIEDSNGGFLVDEEARFQFSESSSAAATSFLGFHLGVKPKARKRVS